MTKSKGQHGGKRSGAGRPRKLREPPAGPIDPESVLHEIAGDKLQPASARVAAARVLMAAGKGGKGDEAGARISDLERRTLEILRRPN